MKMFAILYKPTGVPIGLYVDKENAIARCKHLTASRDFIVAMVEIKQVEEVKFKRNDEGEE